MNEDIIDTLQNSLKLYKKDVEETDLNYESLKHLGKYSITHPYLSKHSMASAIERYEAKGINLSEIRVQYEEINKRLEAFEQKRGNAREKLFEELKHYIKAYPSTVCYFLELDPIDLETGNDIAGRDILEILMMELDHDFDLHDMKIKVEALDNVLKCRFRLNIDLIMKECSFIEVETAPESFWWRHPSRIYLEVQKSREEYAKFQS
ncbi:hypothetical protein [Methanolobus psychrotolerans]|uniref:hypothetical protein n=1 Tax=Methanolobus psychrotolerans TaxID=1874706 RepID=UPI000B9178B2|nr:hypothetical protein [Methanolobus psychrotolerans]